MKYLTGGDTYINNWPTPALAVTQMAKCPAKTHDDIFKDEMAIESGDEDNTAGAQASTLTNDTVIPFPREHPPCLTQEMIHIFGADLRPVPHGSYLGEHQGCGDLQEHCAQDLRPRNPK